ncbi:GNAT family N-acetyltransferase [Brucella intermedia]|uniref:GNAT family N-acetyltransferase n=1 Tax=Brucella TaxID=234 RepID=UPI001115159B|nr:GNAT family N-acetyltransferase [Brucella intermedia]
MSVITVGYSKNVQNTEAFAIIAEGWNEMVQEGFTPDRISFPLITPQTEVLFARSGDELVGCLLWQHDVDSETFEVHMAYVEMSFRKKGAFRAMVTDLQKLARQRKVTRTLFYVGVGNTVAETVLPRLKAKPSTKIYEM